MTEQIDAPRAIGAPAPRRRPPRAGRPSSGATSPAAATIPTWRIPPPKVLRTLRASAMIDVGEGDPAVQFLHLDEGVGHFGTDRKGHGRGAGSVLVDDGVAVHLDATGALEVRVVSEPAQDTSSATVTYSAFTPSGCGDTGLALTIALYADSSRYAFPDLSVNRISVTSPLGSTLNTRLACNAPPSPASCSENAHCLST